MAGTSKLQAKRAFKVVKPKQSKRQTTASTKHHRFESFSQRIAKLKIDPIRRRRNVLDREELCTVTETYFGKSLSEWRDLNLSSTFSSFVREVAPLCDNLALVLHHADTIADLLFVYIDKADGLAMEPLLSLLSHLAHDLDTRFERYFERAVSCVTAVAAKHEDPAVVEWSFTCLAWLFKYLSRLLAPDLRPLYRLMSPYLGKEPQRPFVIRFAAESLSFLVRKAAASYPRDPEPLDRIIVCMLDDCLDMETMRHTDLHRQGLMTLLTDSIKGLHTGLHSNGLYVLQSLLNALRNRSGKRKEEATEIIAGILTSLLHHTDAEVFQSVLAVISAHVTSIERIDSESVSCACRLLLTTVSVRKGTRIARWQTVAECTKHLMRQETSLIEEKSRTDLLSLLAVVLATAPMDGVLPLLAILDNLRQSSYAPYFVQFCEMCSRLSQDRFKTFLLPHFQSFVLEHWQMRDIFVLYVPHLIGDNGGPKIQAPLALQDALLDHIEQSSLAKHSNEDTLKSANIALASINCWNLSDSHLKKLRRTLQEIVESVLNCTESLSASYRTFAVSACLRHLLDLSDAELAVSGLWTGLCSISEDCWALEQFWRNMVRYASHADTAELNEKCLSALEPPLLRTLASPSHGLRKAGLSVISMTYERTGRPLPEGLTAALTVESTPVSLATSRSISLNIRRLAAGDAEVSDDKFWQKAAPTFCFGLLHLRLAQAWDDAIDALVEICKRNNTCEEVVMNLARQWIEGVAENSTDPPEPRRILNAGSDGFQVLSDFECPNLARMQAIRQQVFNEPNSGYPTTEEAFRTVTHHEPAIVPECREKALRVLQAMPKLAEKRSRFLVPIFLRWAGDTEATDIGERWNRKDQKALLAIFAHFSNPRVLYKAGEVHDALLNLCANGDVEIQRSALKAILAWKEPSVVKYEEHLVNLLDDAHFGDEVSSFLQRGADEEIIQPEDYEHLMPVLLRLCYGRAIAGGKHGQQQRRKALFSALRTLGSPIVEHYVDIAISRSSRQYEDVAKMSLRQQLGMLTTLHDLTEIVNADIEPFAAKMLRAAVACTAAAAERLEEHREAEHVDEQSLLRSVRQSGMQCLVELYSTIPGLVLHCQAETETIMATLVAPRLPRLAAENNQSISGLLRLLSTWSATVEGVNLVARLSILAPVADLLQEPSAKDEVRLFLLRDLLDNLLELHDDAHRIDPQASHFIRSIRTVLAADPSKEVLDACVTSLTGLAKHVKDEQDARDLINVCAGLLIKPAKVVAIGTKVSLLQTLRPLLSLIHDEDNSSLFGAVSSLLSRFSGPADRILVTQILQQLSEGDAELKLSARICADLDAQGDRLGEADYERRERGFASIAEVQSRLTPVLWLPIVHTCIFYIRDAEDIVNRSNAAQALKCFIDAASAARGDTPNKFHGLIRDPLLVGIEYGMQQPSELVRAEYVKLLGYLVTELSDFLAVSDMKGLASGEAGDPSFFTDILHIQHQPRLAALDRLAAEAAHLSSHHVSKIFLPLLEHFVFDQAEGDRARNLADRTIATIRALASSMSWSTFRATFKRYVGYVTTKEGLEKVVLRLLGGLVDALKSKEDALPVVRDADMDSGKTQIIMRDLLPPLQEYLHRKDDSTVDRRMPVAVTIVKLLLLLPEAEMTIRLPAILTDVCHVLRSRSQEARDETRKTLAAILSLIGTHHLGFVLKELRSALRNGYQLHVLSFTVHSLLVGLNLSETCRAGDLNESLPDLMAIIMDDVFGVTGQEKDAEEYKSGMKEVKSSKSFDTMELLSRVTPVEKLGILVQPLRALLAEKLDSKSSKKLDELLTRLRKGMDQNEAAGSRDVLVFCHELVRLVYADQNAVATASALPNYKVRKYLVQIESANKLKGRATTSAQMYKLVSFALNLVRKSVRRHEDLLTPTNMAGFLPMIGDALVQGQEEVRVAAMRLLAAIIALPIAELDKNAPVYVKEAVAVIKASTDMHSDSVKAALELVTSVLREKRTVQIRETDVAAVVKALKHDIDEPDQQGTVYKFIRAILGRKMVIPEVYELLDEVAKVMVTNPDRQIRESARSAYLQFVTDFPQGKDRWHKQTAFLVGNLRYEHATGRHSVMELLHQLLARLSDEVLAPLTLTLFVSLVPVLVDDADRACRQMASMLVEKLFGRADEEQLSGFTALMKKWLNNVQKPMLAVAALQCWQIYLRARDDVSVKQCELLQAKLTAFFTDEETIVGAQLLQAILDTVQVLAELKSGTAFNSDAIVLWDSIIQECLTSRDNTIQEKSSQLLESYFTHIARSNADLGLSKLPLRGSYGLLLNADSLRSICSSALQVLKTAQGEEVLASISRNISFLGRVFSASNLHWHKPTDDEEDQSEEEDDSQETNSTTALSFLLRQLSHMIRQDLPVPTRLAAIQCQTSIIKHLDLSSANSSTSTDLRAVVRPLYLLTDSAVPRGSDPHLETLVDKARELLDLLQKQVGTEKFLAALGEARRQVVERRDDRRRKRKVEALSAPEKWAREKRKKHEATRMKKKAHGAEMAGRRRGW